MYDWNNKDACSKTRCKNHSLIQRGHSCTVSSLSSEGTSRLHGLASLYCMGSSEACQFSLLGSELVLGLLVQFSCTGFRAQAAWACHQFSLLGSELEGTYWACQFSLLGLGRACQLVSTAAPYPNMAGHIT